LALRRIRPNIEQRQVDFERAGGGINNALTAQGLGRSGAPTLNTSCCVRCRDRKEMSDARQSPYRSIRKRGGLANVFYNKWRADGLFLLAPAIVMVAQYRQALMENIKKRAAALNRFETI
jgi:hypothetical protein